MTVRASLIGKLPDQDMNGLGALAPAMEDDPNRVWVGIIQFTNRKTEVDNETGDVTVKTGVVSLEPVHGQDAEEALNMLRRAASRRTGMSEIDGFENAATPLGTGFDGDDQDEFEANEPVDMAAGF